MYFKSGLIFPPLRMQFVRNHTRRHQPLYQSNFEDLYFGPWVLAPGQPCLEVEQAAKASTSSSKRIRFIKKQLDKTKLMREADKKEYLAGVCHNCLCFSQ